MLKGICGMPWWRAFIEKLRREQIEMESLSRGLHFVHLGILD
jgi:hypothetical protein